MQGSCGKALAGAAAIVFSLSGAAQHTQPAIKGAGASFPALIYQQWAAAYARESGVALTYTATGSGDGVQRRVGAASSDSTFPSEMILGSLDGFAGMAILSVGSAVIRFRVSRWR